MILNIAAIALVLLIAYWWANQGIFSAIIHLLCVITAGALALALWEPLTVGLLLKGSFFDHYAWAIGLLGPFVVLLFVLRLATNKLVPANLRFPRTADVAFGFPIGLVSGVLTVGLMIIGMGFVQSQRSLAGFVGYGLQQNGNVAELDRMWLPVHKLTEEFYGLLSVGSLKTSRPMRQYYPDLAAQSVSLIRDSWRGGSGQITLRPSQVSVVNAWVCPNSCVVQVRFGRGARDYGEQLTLSAAQIRLVSQAGGFEKPYVAHPNRWSQAVEEGLGVFRFDDASHYATTIPGRESADLVFEFPWRQGLRPAFVQVKGARADIRQVQASTNCGAQLAGGAGGGNVVDPQLLAGTPRIPGSEIRVNNDIRPIMTSTNVLPGTIHHQDKLLTDGFAIFTQDRQQYSRALRISGLFEPTGTRCVQLYVGRSDAANVYGGAAARAGKDAALLLVDAGGNTYTAIGYIYESREGTEVRLDPSRGLTMGDLPHLPTSGNQRIRLIFHVTVNSTVIGFMVGDAAIASCNIEVRDTVTEQERSPDDSDSQLPPGSDVPE